MPRKSTKKRAPKAKKPGLLRYGYWSYPDPAPRIRKLLAKKPELLAEFDALLRGEAEIPLHSLFVTWAKKPDVPAKVRALVALAAPRGNAELFDEVEVASGCGPDMGGMISFTPVLYARRSEGMIGYRTNDDIDAPERTLKPLKMGQIEDLIMGDFAYPSTVASQALELYQDEPRTPELVAGSVGALAESAHYSSEFYDLAGLWKKTVETAVEYALEDLQSEEDE